MNADALDIRLLRFRSKRGESPHALAAALLDADRVSEALEVVHAGLLDGEDDPDLLVLEGRAWFAEGDLPQAQAALLRAAKLQPTHVDAYRWLSQVMMKRGEPNKAVRVLERAATLRPDDAEIRNALARARRLSHIAEQADSGQLEAPAPPPASPGPPPPSPEALLAPASPGPPPPNPEALGRPRSPGPPASPGGPPKTPESPLRRSGTPLAPSRPERPTVPAEISLSDDSLVHALVDSSEVAVEESPAFRPRTPFAEDENTERSVGRPFEEEGPTRSFDMDDAPTGLSEALAADPGADVPDLFVPDDDAPTTVAQSPLESSRPALSADDDAPTTISEPPAAPERLPLSSDDDAPTAISQPPTTLPEPSAAASRSAQPAEASWSGGSAEADEEDPALPLTHGRDADDSFEPAFVAPPEEPAASVATGDGEPGQPEPPERVLAVVKDQGLFEQESAADDSAWVPQRESRHEGTRVRTGLALGWAAALLLAGGGYYGWTRWVEHRHGQAAKLVDEVQAALVEGGPAARRQAEAKLGEARQLDPRAEGVERTAVLLQCMHALEDGGLDVGYLRPALARLEKSSTGSLLGQLATGIIGLSSGGVKQAQSALQAVEEGEPGPEERYLAAALALRVGSPDAFERLEQAALGAGALRATYLEGVAAAAVLGDDPAALDWLQRAIKAGASGRRVELWQHLLSTRGPVGADVPAGNLEPLPAQAAITDRLLYQLVKARRAHTAGESDAVGEAIGEAAALAVRDPQLLALLARVASDVGAHETAYAAARGALQTAPDNAAYRDAMVRALLSRGDGEAVERALSSAPADAEWVVVARARSALLTGKREALQEASKRLPALVEGEENPELEALLLRVELRLGKSPRALLGRARRLAHAEGGSGRVQLALGETALAARDAETAVEALEAARARLSDSGELLQQLARAYRMAGKSELARQTFERAVQVAPELAEARAELARIALARGEWAAAEKGFAQLAQRGDDASYVLGRAEALIGLGRLLDARELLSELPEDGREVMRLQVMLQLAQRELRKAEELAEKLLDDGGRTAQHLTLYGDVLFADDEVDKAAGAYDAALEEDGDYPEALIGRARAAVRAEKLNQAYRWLDAAEKALAEATRPPAVRAQLLTTRGTARIMDRDFDDAYAALSEAVTLEGVPAEAYFWLGEAQALTKQGGARESYERYLELAPEGDLAGRARRALKPR